MTSSPRLRHDHRGFSAFYGVFAVILAATVVFGALAASSPVRQGTDQQITSKALANEFLSTLLALTEPSTNLSAGQALTRMCLAAPCGDSPTPLDVIRWLGARSAELARPLGAEFLLVLSVGDLQELRAGTLEARTALPLARAELYHAGIDGFVALVLFLGPD